MPHLINSATHSTDDKDGGMCYKNITIIKLVFYSLGKIKLASKFAWHQ